ncbi:MAG: amidohydrolase [Rhodoferax sp.]|nr:amidohydrolase [Rhodoferax sp.]
MRIDAHFHSWRLDRGDYGWLTPALAPIYRDVTVEDWLAQAAPCGVVGGLLVQAAPTEAETGFLLDLAARHASVLGVVGWVDLSAADAPQQVMALARQPRLKGLRPMLQDLSDPDWILRPEVQPGLAQMAECGLVLDALIKPVHLPRILQLAKRHPTLAIVIDHAAKPDIGSGQWESWARGLACLAELPQVSCKLSGLMTEAGPLPQTSVCRPWVRHVAGAFGPDRVLWGSDWPVLELAGRYADWWQECHRTLVLCGWGAEAVDGALGGNAQRVYRL